MIISLCLIIYWRGILYVFIDIKSDFTLSAWILDVRLIFITFGIILPIIRWYLKIRISNSIQRYCNSVLKYELLLIIVIFTNIIIKINNKSFLMILIINIILDLKYIFYYNFYNKLKFKKKKNYFFYYF